MAKKYKIKEEQKEELQKARKSNFTEGFVFAEDELGAKGYWSEGCMGASCSIL